MKKLTRLGIPSPERYQVPTRSLCRLSHGMILAGFSGFVSLSYEIFFLHVPLRQRGNSVVLTLVLGAILLGIASGAREASDRAKISGAKSTEFISALTWASVIGLIVLPIMAHSDILRPVSCSRYCRWRF